MGRASSSKKVARAASTGGGRTTRGAKPLGWYAAIAMVVILGVAGIVFSRAERRDELAGGKNLTAPAVGRDHWHAAYGVFLCDKFVAPVTDERDPKGIHTHGDGIIHIHPTVRSAAGKNAVLSTFADAIKMTLTDNEIRLPGGKAFTEGKTKCNGKPGIVQVKVGDKVVTENISKIKYADGQLLTIAFAPKGAELAEPPSKAKLNNLEDVAKQPPVQVPVDPNSTAPVPGAPNATGTPAPEPGATEGGTPTTAAP